MRENPLLNFSPPPENIACIQEAIYCGGRCLVNEETTNLTVRKPRWRKEKIEDISNAFLTLANSRFPEFVTE
jgi:hypothetical protein